MKFLANNEKAREALGIRAGEKPLLRPFPGTRADVMDGLKRLRMQISGFNTALLVHRWTGCIRWGYHTEVLEVLEGVPSDHINIRFLIRPWDTANHNPTREHEAPQPGKEENPNLDPMRNTLRTRISSSPVYDCPGGRRGTQNLLLTRDM
ncbi:hypothetical protein HO173_008393 [Letharia columbiana]|uniref:Uncharacterized protein n=1 Tax=Letharia columbiana TaxID=112416 RepID=A0A8H6L2U7_9LECA|nr:uncharacterized protein HO173_008393 [Letharia columbiana]KAF6233461.1 hypothetical protein HO173_008393 [Letharia columbiana]